MTGCCPIWAGRPMIIAALGYGLLGGFGWLFVLPPAAYPPFWPAAGFALAVVLRHGLPALPGLWFGAFGLAVALSWARGDSWVQALVLAGLFALGATLQAAAGVWLCRRGLGQRWRLLERERDVLWFMVWGGLVAGAVSAGVWVAGLLLLGELESGVAARSWWWRYSADVLGIALFGPLSLCVLSRDLPLWRDRQWRVLVPVMLALGAVSVLHVDARRFQWQEATERLAENGGVIYAWLAPAVGLAGILAVVLFQVFLLGLTGRESVVARKNAEIRASRESYLQLFNESPLPTWLYDAASLRFLMVNERAVACYGWPRDTLLAMRLTDIVLPEDLAVYPGQGPAQAGDGPPGGEFRHRTRDGSLITVRVSSSPTRYGETPARLEVIEDITERREVERVLMESEQRFRRLFEDSPQA